MHFFQGARRVQWSHDPMDPRPALQQSSPNPCPFFLSGRIRPWPSVSNTPFIFVPLKLSMRAFWMGAWRREDCIELISSSNQQCAVSLPFQRLYLWLRSAERRPVRRQFAWWIVENRADSKQRSNALTSAHLEHAGYPAAGCMYDGCECKYSMCVGVCVHECVCVCVCVCVCMCMCSCVCV